MVRKLVVLAVIASFALAGVVGCGSKVTKSNYDKISDGMTTAQVEGILGKGQKASAGVSIAGLSVTGDVYQWKDGDKSISVVFKDGKVVGKSQSGL
jgi:hypothetical protein